MTDHNELPVTGEDREAMVAYEKLSSIPLSPEFAKAILNGEHDGCARVQAFARHAEQARLKERERAAGIADKRATEWRASIVGGTVGYAFKAEQHAAELDDIAAAIRSVDHG